MLTYVLYSAMINGTFLGGVAFTANDTASLSVTLPLNQVILDLRCPSLVVSSFFTI